MADMGRRLDAAVSLLDSMESRMTANFPQLAGSLDKLVSVAMGSASAWEEELGGCESRLTRVGEQVQLLSESLLQQLSALQTHGEADRSALTQRLLHLEDDLASEQSAHRATKSVHPGIAVLFCLVLLH